MQAKAECQVLNELIRPVKATSLTAQTGLETGLTGSSADDANSTMKDDSIIVRRSELEGSSYILFKGFWSWWRMKYSVFGF